MEKALSLWVEGMTENVFLLMATCCASKDWVCTETSSRDSLKWVTPSHLLQLRVGCTDSGIGLAFITSHHHHRKRKKRVCILRDHIHITFITVYYYNYCIWLCCYCLSLTMPNLWIKLYHWCENKGKKHNTYRVWYYPQFQAFIGGLGTHSLQMRRS